MTQEMIDKNMQRIRELNTECNRLANLEKLGKLASADTKYAVCETDDPYVLIVYRLSE